MIICYPLLEIIFHKNNGHLRLGQVINRNKMPEFRQKPERFHL